ncbi:MAG: RelA/SpoT family protein [bacterium]
MVFDGLRENIRIADVISLVKKHYRDVSINLIRNAYNLALRGHAGQVRKSGRPYIEHLLSVAYILAQHRMDTITVSAGILHDILEDTEVTQDEIEKTTGSKEVIELVNSVTKLSRVPVSSELSEVMNLRRLLLAMAKDLRVVIIKLADRLDNLRDLYALDDDRIQGIAKETQDIFMPIASRLGMGAVRFEMEDLTLRYLNPTAYFDIAEKIAMKRVERERQTDEIVDEISLLLKENEMDVKVSGRPKHIASIYNKMKDVRTFDEIHDLIGVRIITRSVAECYQALGLVHSKYKPIPTRFRDYIALPKQNGYRSLHTTVVDERGRKIELQIRTEEMHRLVEVGVAAHWKYKMGEKPIFKDREHLAFIDRVLEWQKDLARSDEIMAQLTSSFFEDEVFVFTPKGEVKPLPVGATPLDLAFAIHTDLGMKATGAKINGKMVPFYYKLRTGDVVEILTAAHQKPSRDWLNYIVSSKAKAKLRQFFRELDRDFYIDKGRKAFEEEAKRAGLSYERISEVVKDIIKEYGFDDDEGLFLAIGEGQLSARRIMKQMVGELSEVRRRKKPSSVLMVKLEGEGDIDFHIAGCCLPSPTDDIVGYITVGKGISIHRANCWSLKSRSKERVIKAQWVGKVGVVVSKIVITAENRSGMFASISDMLDRNGANILEYIERSSPDGRKTSINLLVSNDKNISKSELIENISELDGVLSVKIT